jgi:hypothetical protein
MLPIVGRQESGSLVLTVLLELLSLHVTMLCCGPIRAIGLLLKNLSPELASP